MPVKRKSKSKACKMTSSAMKEAARKVTGTSKPALRKRMKLAWKIRKSA